MICDENWQNPRSAVFEENLLTTKIAYQISQTVLLACGKTVIEDKLSVRSE